jgi:hypothetical protein
MKLHRRIVSRLTRLLYFLRKVPLMRLRIVALLIPFYCFSLIPSFSHAAALQVFTNRTAWQNALADQPIRTDTFNSFTGFTYSVGAPAFQFPSGIADIGLLRFDVDRPSGNLIVGGDFFDPIDGSTFWRVEASTQNGSTPPVTPALLFPAGTVVFGADWNHFFEPRAAMTFGGNTLQFSDYLSSGLSFFGVIAASPLNSMSSAHLTHCSTPIT